MNNIIEENASKNKERRALRIYKSKKVKICEAALRQC